MSGRLRVGFELTALEVDASGAARAIVALRDALARRDDVELVPFAQPRARVARSRVARGLAREALWYPVGLPLRTRRARVAVLHCPVGLAPPRPLVPTVVTVNDAMALDHPEWFSRANVFQQRHLLGRALHHARAVITPTRHAAREVGQAFGVAPERISVAPYGIDARFGPGEPAAGLADRLGLTAPWILTVGTLQPRKNLEAAVRAFERLVADGAPHQLVVAGGRGWHDEALAARLRDSPAAHAIRLPGRVSDDDLIGLYRGAAALVFPSRHEGFGFPPLEAMACGAPVVCSDRGSLPEVVGDAALLVDPDDDAAIARTLVRALRPEVAARLRTAGFERASQFTWERCAALTAAVYREAAR